MSAPTAEPESVLDRLERRVNNGGRVWNEGVDGRWISRNHLRALLGAADALRRIAENDPPPEAESWMSGKSWRIELAKARIRPLTAPPECEPEKWLREGKR